MVPPSQVPVVKVPTPVIPLYGPATRAVEIFPVVRLVAFNAVIPRPLPANVVAVSAPFTLTPPATI